VSIAQQLCDECNQEFGPVYMPPPVSIAVSGGEDGMVEGYACFCSQASAFPISRTALERPLLETRPDRL